MEQYKYVILGAGPAGLGFAGTLMDLGETSFLILEKESVPGGLCRSRNVDGAPLDMGGGHFLDTNNKVALDFLFRFMPRHEWYECQRISKICIRGTKLDYPLEANLWQFPLDDQLDFLESMAQSGCVQGLPQPNSFVDWIYWKLGKCIAEEYMLPYNRKLWSIDLMELGTYWLEKLPDLSFREVLQSCLEKKPSGKIPAHEVFLYPRAYGFGEVWRRIGEALSGQLRLLTPVTSVDIAKRVINESFRADKIITTIPWPQWLQLADLPAPIEECIHKLRYISIDVDYYEKTIPSAAHWIYHPDERLPYHRILCRNNFCKGSRGHWTETNSLRAAGKSSWRYRNDYAYPLNTVDKPKILGKVGEWAESNNVFGIGRWGRWQHMNSDMAVQTGIETARKMVKGLRL